MSYSTWARCLAAAACAMAVQAAAAQAISAAETLLFQTNHLRNVRPPLTLNYAFVKAGSVEPGFTDEVKVILAPATETGKLVVTMQFLTGSRQRKAPDVDNPEGNPALLGFLERDIAEMQRLTGGQGNYFRKRIRLALAAGAQVRPQRFTYAGKPLDGREVQIQPYVDDPMRARFEKYVNKTYTFVISEQVPGGVYQVRTSLAGLAGSAPQIDETLTLVSAEGGKR